MNLLHTKVQAHSVKAGAASAGLHVLLFVLLAGSSAAAAAQPCGSAAHHALDFWIGDWTVTVRGHLAGKSHIEPALGGCAILEQWTAVYGAPGRSISAYDAGTKRWTQRYVSGGGRITDYVGTILPGGSVQFVAPMGSVQIRMTYTRLHDGSVRQRFEQSTDRAKSWSPPNDLIYTRAKPAKSLPSRQ